MNTMQNIHVGRYTPVACGYLGFIEPEDRSWILFIPVEGKPQLYAERDPVTGAVIEDGKVEHTYDAV